MSSDDKDPVHTSVYLPRALYQKLRKRLFDEGQSFSGWVKEQAERFTAD